MLEILRKNFYTVVEIDSASLKIVSMDAAKERLLLAAVRDIPDKSDKEEQKKLIIETLIKSLPANILKHSSTILCLSDEESLQVKRIELPYMPQNEMAEAIRWRIKGIVPFDVNKAVLDFDIIQEMTDEDNAKKLSVIIAALPKEIVDKKVALLTAAGLNVAGVNIGSFGLSKIICAMPEKSEGKACALLKIGRVKSDVNIYREARLVFVRHIPIGLDHIKDAVKGPVVSESGLIELTDQGTAKLKEVGIPDNKEPLLGGKLQGRHLLALLRPVLESMCNEVRRSIDYYNTQLEGREIKALCLAGEGSDYKNLEQYIKATLDMKTEYLKLPAAITDATPSKDGTREIIPLIIDLIGVCCSGVGAKADLLPAEYKIEKVQKIEKISIRMVGFTMLSILLASFVLVNVRIAGYRKSLVTATSHKKTLHEIESLYDRIKERKALIDGVRSLELPTVAILKELSNIIPDDVVLTSLLIDQKARVLRFNGNAYYDSDVTDFMQKMERSSLFKDVNLESSHKSTIKGEDAESFVINCAIQR